MKFDIINLLHLQDMTVSQLSRSLRVSRTSIYRYVDNLEKRSILTKVNKMGAEVYYQLNYEFFRIAKMILDQYLNSLFDESV